MDAGCLPGVAPAIRRALEYADDIVGETDLLALLGPLYVLEGSQNGAMALRRDFARCLDLPEKNLSYPGCYGRATAARWDTFLDILGTLSLDAGQQARIAAAAIACFENLAGICTRCTPTPPAISNTMRPPSISRRAIMPSRKIRSRSIWRCAPEKTRGRCFPIFSNDTAREENALRPATVVGW
jgi:hypothetical protein